MNQTKFAEANTTFAGGAQRGDDTGRTRPDLIPGDALLRIGLRYAAGAEHYGERNFERGIPSSRGLASLERHLQQFKAGDKEEDHLSAIVFNAILLMINEDRIELGSFKDLPWYKEEHDV